MLTVHRPDPELFSRTPWYQTLNWDRAAVAVVAILHVWASFTLLLAPHEQLFTRGTRPVFDLFPPAAWSGAFFVGGVCASLLVLRVTAGRQMATWLTVCPAQTIWLGASIIAVSHGGGSAMGVVFLSAVFAFTVLAAIKVAVDYSTGKR